MESKGTSTRSALKHAILNPAAQQPASITSLPTELLTMIFRYVYLQEPAYHSNIDRRRRDRDKHVSHTFFPYCLSDVCPRWHCILGTVAEYWTKPVIDVGRDATPVAYARSNLDWSHDLPLAITVLRRDGYEGCDTLEIARVASIIRTIVPHLHRIWAIDVDVIDSVSLPCLATDFRGAATSLCRISFASTMDSGASDQSAALPRSILPLPQLRRLDIDGENFRVLTTVNPSWLKCLPHLYELSISNPSNSAGPREGFSLLMMLKGLRENSNIEGLTLRNVTFDLAQSPAHRIPLKLQSCELIGLKTEDLAEFFRLTYLGYTEKFTIGSSTLAELIPRDDDTYIGAFYFTLKDVCGDVVGFLRAVSAPHLKIINVPSFDDFLLMQLDRVPSFDNLLGLSICGCPKVSSRIIRIFAENRRTAALRCLEKNPYEENISQDVSVILEINYDGDISPEDREWFTPALWTGRDDVFHFEYPGYS
ncbi:hypothetical protein PLICRDRAFT_37447 [Plicaturopsis crispa FD-325 SS-3]|nr:hypothetical protein PLICRDRAFT_37447 [Plicaturopsis crispa FD-325 SS-3]